MCFSLGFITRETGFRWFRQLMCFGALGRSPSTTGGGFVSLQVRGSFRFKIRGFSTSVDYLDYLGVLSRTLGLRIGGYLPWLRHWK